MESSNTKTCPRCQQQFACGLAQGRDTCWCFDCPRVLPIIENADCFCPTCLQEEIAVQTAVKAKDASKR